MSTIGKVQEMYNPADALKKWDDEEEQLKKELVQQTKQEMATSEKSRWRQGDQYFVRKLINLSLKAAEESAKRHEENIRDIFLLQASVLQEELKQLECGFPAKTVKKKSSKKKAQKSKIKKR